MTEQKYFGESGISCGAEGRHEASKYVVPERKSHFSKKPTQNEGNGQLRRALTYTKMERLNLQKPTPLCLVTISQNQAINFIAKK